MPPSAPLVPVRPAPRGLKPNPGPLEFFAALLSSKFRFARDSLLEGDGFEPSVPRQKDNAFRDSSFPTCARATAAFENARRPVQQLLLPVVDPVRLNAELANSAIVRSPRPPPTTTPSL